MITEVELSRQAKKQLKKVPNHIVRKFVQWSKDVMLQGLEEVRKIPGYHDEPLLGKRKGERSIRLSKAYRAIYILKKDGSVEFVYIEEVNKHEY